MFGHLATAVAMLQWPICTSKMNVNPGGKPMCLEMTADQMRTTVDDFKNEKNQERTISAFLLTFHSELNPIERVWTQFTQKHIAHRHLRTLDSVSLKNRKGFMFTYLEGKNLDEACKKYK